MKKYYVGIREVQVVTCVVEADNPEQAKLKAEEMYSNCADGLQYEYSHTLDKEMWDVCEDMWSPGSKEGK